MNRLPAHLIDLARAIIEGSSSSRPADQVLRASLAEERKLSPGERREVAQAVFAFYRWRGWLTSEEPEGIERAGELAQRFSADPGSFADEELMARAVPGWLGEDMPITAAWVRALQEPPRVWLRAAPERVAALMSELGDCDHPGWPGLPEAIEYRGSADLFRSAAFHRGDFELQDISSQAVSRICAPKAGETWWDVCAGEGGKLLHLSRLMGNKGLIWATDRSERRLRNLKRRAARAGAFNYQARLWEGGKAPVKQSCHGALLDAPCSGVGTWQRNPHARWTLRKEDIVELQQRQLKLLSDAAGALKAGGKLVYAVCTLTNEETLQVVEQFEKKFAEFSREPSVNPFRLEEEGLEQHLFWPQEYGGNGMFVAVWRRK